MGMHIGVATVSDCQSRGADSIITRSLFDGDWKAMDHKLSSIASKYVILCFDLLHMIASYARKLQNIEFLLFLLELLALPCLVLSIVSELRMKKD